jgi:hypothetical protein
MLTIQGQLWMSVNKTKCFLIIHLLVECHLAEPHSKKIDLKPNACRPICIRLKHVEIQLHLTAGGQ